MSEEKRANRRKTETDIQGETETETEQWESIRRMMREKQLAQSTEPSRGSARPDRSHHHR